MKRTIGHITKVGQLQLTKEVRTALGLPEGGPVMFDVVSTGKKCRLVITPVPPPDLKQLRKELAKLPPVDLRACHTKEELDQEAESFRKAEARIAAQMRPEDYE
ncbi:MAG: hypothetical protein AB1705_14625 [Verrucomicrobiota bacterium]